MRWFALGLLLVINLVLLLWQLQVHQPEQRRPAALPDVGELRLLSELELPETHDVPASESDPEVVEEPVIAVPEPEEATDPAVAETAASRSPATGDPLAVELLESQEFPETGSSESDESAATESEPMLPEPVHVPAKESALEPLVEQEPAMEEEVTSLPEETRAPEDEPVTEEVVAEPGQVCWQLGPFDSEAEADELADRLPEGIRKLQLEKVRVKLPNGYYVLIPPLVDRDEALEVERSLKQKGIEDSWVFISGPLKNAVSLGLFNREINARRRLQRVEAKGFQPELRPRFRHGEKALLLVIGPEGEQSEDALGQLVGGDPEPIPCP